jgi:hypothetical protein
VALTRQRESAKVFAALETARDTRQLARQIGRAEIKAASIAYATADELTPAQGLGQVADALRRRRSSSNNLSTVGTNWTNWTKRTFRTISQGVIGTPMPASARRPVASPKLVSPAASEMIGIFAKRNPKLNRRQVETVGKLVAEFGAAAVKLSPAARQLLVARKPKLKRLIDEILAEPDNAAEPLKLTPKSAEVSQGAGIGPTVSKAEGRKRLAASATPEMPEAWAGQLAGPTQLERDFGIARSTLHTWQKQGVVIGVQVGIRKYAFPVEQFIDGRPVAGLKPVVEAVGETRTAWRWLREPNPGLAGATPLARLKAGGPESVLEVARSNFGRR